VAVDAGAGEFRAAGDVALREQFDNHDGFRPQAGPFLAGRATTLVLADGAELKVKLDADGTARWEMGAERGACAYEAFELRDGIVAVAARVGERRSVFAVVRGDRGIAAFAVLEDRPEGVAERTTYVQFGVGGPLAEPFEPTAELVGKRIHWRYSSTHAFEHIYLDASSYCWHCIEGPERGIGDVDPCVYYRLAEDLYLFSWSETVVPFNGAVAIDLREGSSTGRFFGWDTDRSEAEQIVVGARGTLLNVTAYPDAA
jgi:hypothetical protein